MQVEFSAMIYCIAHNRMQEWVLRCLTTDSMQISWATLNDALQGRNLRQMLVEGLSRESCACYHPVAF